MARSARGEVRPGRPRISNKVTIKTRGPPPRLRFRPPATALPPVRARGRGLTINLGVKNIHSSTTAPRAREAGPQA